MKKLLKLLPLLLMLCSMLANAWQGNFPGAFFALIACGFYGLYLYAGYKSRPVLTKEEEHEAHDKHNGIG